MGEIVFDERIARTYDEYSPEQFRPEVVAATVDFLAALAGDGAALELAIGTGRIGLPLSRRGVRVHGIDISPPMVDQLRAKPGGTAIDVAIGDLSITRVDGEFALVYLVYNTISNLTTQDAQVECFRNAAAHLVPGGCFVVELYVPPLRLLPPGENVRSFALSPAYVAFDEFTDFAAQISWSHHYRVVGDRLDVFSAPFRYVWPSELDLMARLAGMRLRERWADWQHAPFTGQSPSHVSVWEKLAHDS
jgi:SAM-dependent methyltransferase